MKIVLPKQTVLASAERTFLKGGLFDGALGIVLQVSPEVAEGASFGDAFGPIVKALLEVELPKQMPIVRISGALERIEERSMSALLKALTHYGRKVQIVATDPGNWPEWMQHASWLIVRTTKPFLLWPANEVWYKPDALKEGPVEDVQMPPGPKPAQQFMYLERTLSTERTEELMLTSQYAWALL